jgi:PAS domain S-box-containing protein
VWAGIIFTVLYAISLYNYLLFHSLAEIFSVAVAVSIFMFAWNSRRYFTNDFFLFIGILYLFAGGLDLLHTLTFKGVNILKGYDSNLPTQIWIATQYLKSICMLLSLRFLRRRGNPIWIMGAFAGVVGLILVSILQWNIFPDAYIEGKGLTPFKNISEYIIALILLVTIIVLQRRYHEDLDPQVRRLLIASLATAILSELTFTLYINVYSVANLIGHFFKLLSYYLIYMAIIQTGLIKPYTLLFRALQRTEQQYRALFTYSLNGLALFQIVPNDYQYVEVNQAFENLTGMSRTDLIDKRLSEIHPVIDVQRLQAQAIPSQMEYYSETLGKHLSVSVFSPNAGQIALVLEDITERIQAVEALQTSEARLRGVLENMPVMLAASNADGSIITWNRECERVTGYSVDEINTEALQFHNPLWRDQDYRDLETMLISKTGAKRYISWSNISKDFPVPGWKNWAVGADITKRKLSEERAALLLSITSELSQAVNPEDVATVILKKGLLATGAQRGMVALLNEDSTALEFAQTTGMPDALVSEFEYMPLESKSAIVDAVRSQQPIWFETFEEYSTRYPQHARVIQAHIPDQSGACIPMIVNGRLVGALGFSFVEPYQFTPDKRDFLQTLAHQCAQAIMRAQLHKQEQEMAAIQERQRLARELHDAVSQALFAATITAEALPRLMDRNPDKARQNLIQLHQLIRGALTETRNLVLELRPPAMITVEIDRLLHQLAEVVQVRKQMEIDVDADHTINLPPDIKLAFYRIAQEALTNIAKHAKATQAEIHLHQQQGIIELVISDNGHGFDADDILSGSQGFAHMQERAHSIGAQLSVESQPGKGTLITVTWPQETANQPG